MEFVFNNHKWLIEQVDEAIIIDKLQKQDDNKILAAFGLCDYKTHTIWIDKNMCFDQKVQTLTHELTHCYLWCLGLRFEDYPEETLCDMMYGLMEFVSAVMDKWKKENKE